MKLTDTAIRKAKPPADKSYRMFDGRGLYIEVPLTGHKRWRFKYRFEGKCAKRTKGLPTHGA